MYIGRRIDPAVKRCSVALFALSRVVAQPGVLDPCLRTATAAAASCVDMLDERWMSLLAVWGGTGVSCDGRF
jgi:hypothetical protein